MKLFEDRVLKFMERFNVGDLDGAIPDFEEEGKYIDEFGTT